MKTPVNERLRILIVEDEAIIAMGVQMELELAGYEVCQIVATGEAAVANVAANAPDLVLMDHRLAGKMDGVEAAQAIRDLDSVPPISIIFMTGYAGQDMMERAQELNPLGYLIKPVRVAEMQTMIEAIR
jgi:two-component system, response regulator PdtaR